MAANTPSIGIPGVTARALCKRNWWVFLIGGIASVIFGVLALANPGIALLLLATFFAASLLVDGGVNVYGGITHRDKDGWWVLVLIGVLGVAVGGYLLMNPQLSMIAFVYVVAFTAVFLGALCIALGFKVRKQTEREWVLYLTGAVSVLFGVLIYAQPLTGALSVVYMIAAWAIIIGVLRIIFSFKMKNLPETA